MSLTTYERLFGAGPRGMTISVITFAVAFLLDRELESPPLHGSTTIGIAALVTGSAAAAAIVIWSLRSLPPGARGKELVTAGAFHYLRHPLYAGILGPLNLGLALFLDGWVYLAWVVIQYPIWHWNIAAEERLMHKEFGDKYATYCSKTGRFLPKFYVSRLTFRQ